MSNENAIVKVGRNAIEVEVLEQIPGGWLVKSLSSERIFRTKTLVRYPDGHTYTQTARPLSLFEAVIKTLQSQPEGTSLNTRELVALAAESGLWTHNGAKTPEQTLYSAIFREIATKEFPRIVKSAGRGKFELGRQNADK